MSESGKFCHLFGELAISYNGKILKGSPKGKQFGTVLTTDGKVLLRNSCQDPWEVIFTPAVFFFYENKTGIFFKVDTCEQRIRRVTFKEDCHDKDSLFVRIRGRILDCTDRKIYEVKNGKLCPVCDLCDEKTEKLLVFTQTVSACADIIFFEVNGSNQKVLDDVSQIPSGAVNFDEGTILTTFVPPGVSRVLFYKAEVCDEKVLVAQLIIREADPPRFSVRCATGVSATPTTFPAVINPCPAPTDVLLVPPTGPLSQLIGFETIYSVPAGQDSVPIWTVPQTGDYDIHAVISYSRSGEVQTAPLDNFVLLQQRGSQVAVVGRVLAGLNGQAVFNLGLRLLAGDVLSLYLASAFPSPDLIYLIFRLGTSFHTHLEGCALEAPFPL